MSRSYTLKTTCDRCGAVEEHTLDEAPGDMDDKPPAVQVLINGVVDVEYDDLCSKCPTVVQNYADRIAKRPAKKDALTVEPEPPAPVYWDPGNGEMVWVTGKVGVDSKAYSHKPVSEDVVRIPALEGVTDPAEAGALIAAYEEAE